MGWLHIFYLFHEEKYLITPTLYVILDFLQLHLNKILNSLWSFYNTEAAETTMYRCPFNLLDSSWTLKTQYYKYSNTLGWLWITKSMVGDQVSFIYLAEKDKDQSLNNFHSIDFFLPPLLFFFWFFSLSQLICHQGITLNESKCRSPLAGGRSG